MEDQRTDGWFRERLGVPSASRFHDIMAKGRGGAPAASRKNYAVEIALERITGVRIETYQSWEMKWGIENEPLARTAFEAETGYTVEDAFFVKHDVLDAGASPDGDVLAMPGDDGDGTLEIKCPNSATHLETLMKQRVPPQYAWQIQGQMQMTKKTWGYYVSFDPRMPLNTQLYYQRVERDPEMIAELEDELRLFNEEVDQIVQFITSYDSKGNKTPAGAGVVKVTKKAAK